MFRCQSRSGMFATTHTALLGTALAAALALAPYASAEVYEPPHPEPSAEEVAILELMNRFRADPPAEGQRILDATDLPGFFWRGVDREMFRNEVNALPPAPPLVFDFNALLAARQHAHYMIINNQLTHHQEPGKPGFTGKSFSDRMKYAKFSGSPGGENAFRDAGNAWQSHAAFIIDFGPGGPGGMQNGRGHRMNMAKASFNVIGASAVAHGNRFSVIHKFGKVKGRFVGGAIYTDRNRNGIFDPGEERAHISVRLADGSADGKTWSSGGYTLPLGGSANALVITVGDLVNTIPIPAGNDNVHISWAVPPSEELAAADRLIAAVADIPDEPRNATKRRRALIALWMGSQVLDLDHDRQSRINELCGDIAKELKAGQDAYLAAISSGDRRQLSEVHRQANSDWRGTAAAPWFEEAALLAKAQQGVDNFLKAKEAGRELDERNVSKLREALGEAQLQSTHADIRGRYSDLLSQVKP